MFTEVLVEVKILLGKIEIVVNKKMWKLERRASDKACKGVLL